MRTVKSGIESIKLLGKDHHIPIIRLRDEGDPFHLTEILRLGQGDPHSISRVSAVGDDVLWFIFGFRAALSLSYNSLAFMDDASLRLLLGAIAEQQYRFHLLVRLMVEKKLITSAELD